MRSKVLRKNPKPTSRNLRKRAPRTSRAQQEALHAEETRQKDDEIRAALSQLTVAEKDPLVAEAKNEAEMTRMGNDVENDWRRQSSFLAGQVLTPYPTSLLLTDSEVIC